AGGRGRRTAGREGGAEGGDLRTDVLHRVVDREGRGQRAAGAVDVDLDVAVGRLVLEEQELRGHGGRHVVVDDAADEDHAVAEEPGVDVVGALPASIVGDHGWNEVHLLFRSYLLGKKPIRSFGFGGGFAIARYALNSATLRCASNRRE